jgi:hypothetical protein
MSFDTEAEHRAALANLFRHRPVHYGPPAPPQTQGQTNAAAILNRLRNPPPPPTYVPLRIVESGEHSLGFGRWRFAKTFYVKFNREPLIAETKSMLEWAERNCERGFRSNGVNVFLYNATDWNLFITSYK